MDRAVIACPWCGRINDCHEQTAGRARPEAGDVGVCWGCHRAAVFIDTPFGLSQERPSAELQAEIDADPEIARAVAALRGAGPLGPEVALDVLRGSS